MDKVTLAFPGLGIGDFVVNKVALTIPLFGGIEIRWYGLLITMGMVLAFLYAYYRCKNVGISMDDLLDFAIFGILAGVIGARLYYVIFYEGHYDSFIDVIAIWNGGLAIYGGIIGGALALFLVSKYKKISFLKLFDCVAPGVMIAQAMGRWGNFCNGEAYGGIVSSDSPLYFLRMGVYPHLHDYLDIPGMIYVHPTFFYESLWNFVGFILINIFYKKKKFDGEIFFWYIAWYGFGRMFIEGLRTDSLWIGPFRASQVVGLLCFLVGTAFVVVFRAREYKKSKKEIEDGTDH